MYERTVQCYIQLIEIAINVYIGTIDGMEEIKMEHIIYAKASTT